jgi:hypothetical protein
MKFVKGFWIRLCVWVFYLILVRKIIRPTDAGGDIWTVVIALVAMVVSSNLFNRVIPKRG